MVVHLVLHFSSSGFGHFLGLVAMFLKILFPELFEFFHDYADLLLITNQLTISYQIGSRLVVFIHLTRYPIIIIEVISLMDSRESISIQTINLLFDLLTNILYDIHIELIDVRERFFLRRLLIIAILLVEGTHWGWHHPASLLP